MSIMKRLVNAFVINCPRIYVSVIFLQWWSCAWELTIYERSCWLHTDDSWPMAIICSLILISSMPLLMVKLMCYVYLLIGLFACHPCFSFHLFKKSVNGIDILYLGTSRTYQQSGSLNSSGPPHCLNCGFSSHKLPSLFKYNISPLPHQIPIPELVSTSTEYSSN